MRLTPAPCLLVLVLACITTAAGAKNWVIDYAHSRIGFTGTEGETPFEGSFKNFKADIDFDPAHPEAGKITAIIDTASATAGSSERDSLLPQTDWFDAKDFPTAQFVATKIRETGAGQFEADGTLTIKGIERPVALPFALTQEGDHWRAHGNANLIRTAFHLGTGQWANENYVKYNVNVVVDLTAKPGQ